MSVRCVSGLWLARRCAGPRSIPHGRPRGAKAAGLRYEAALARALPVAEHGPWFEFRDVNGPGWCQPDLLVCLGGSRWLVLEAKYTWTLEGHQQVDRLYRPVVTAALAKPTLGVVVCKVLTPETAKAGAAVTSELWDAIEVASTGVRTVLHWMGKSALALPVLWPQSAPAIAPSTGAPVGPDALGI